MVMHGHGRRQLERENEQFLKENKEDETKNHHRKEKTIIYIYKENR